MLASHSDRCGCKFCLDLMIDTGRCDSGKLKPGIALPIANMKPNIERHVANGYEACSYCRKVFDTGVICVHLISCGHYQHDACYIYEMINAGMSLHGDTQCSACANHTKKTMEVLENAMAVNCRLYEDCTCMYCNQ